MRDKELFGYNELYKEIDKMLESTKERITPNSSGYELFHKLKVEIENLGIINNELKWKELYSIIISYFIIDVTENTLLYFKENKNLNEILKYGKFKRKYITKDIIKFSDCASEFNEKIKKFIDTKIINSFNVNRFDGKSKFILRQLFKAYYENPRQMPKKQLIILAKNIQNILKDIPELEHELEGTHINFKKLYEVNEDYVDINSLDDLLNNLKLNLYEDLKALDSDISLKEQDSTVEELNMEEIFRIMKKIVEIIGIDMEKLESINEFDKILKILNENIFLYANKYSLKEIRNIEDKEIKEYLLSMKGLSELHYVYLSTICDYISQMTDDYAIKEYKELYLINNHHI